MIFWFKYVSVILLLVALIVKLLSVGILADSEKTSIVWDDEKENQKTENDILKSKSDVILYTSLMDCNLIPTEIVFEFTLFLNQLPSKHISGVPTPPPQVLVIIDRINNPI